MKPGEKITVTTGGKTYVGRLQSIQMDYDEGLYGNYSGRQELTIALDSIMTTKPPIPLGGPGVTVGGVSSGSKRPIMMGSTIRTLGTPPGLEYPIIKEEDSMFQATLVYDKACKRVNVHMQVGDSEVYIDRDGGETERKLGEEMPVFASFPIEHLEPILNAAQAEFHDVQSGRVRFR